MYVHMCIHICVHVVYMLQERGCLCVGAWAYRGVCNFRYGYLHVDVHG